MKIPRITILIVIALVAGSYVFAQNDYRNNRSDRSNRSDRPSRHNHGGGENGVGSTNGVPTPDAYQEFSTFIAKRNIFDPNRVPNIPGGTIIRPRIQRGAPFFMLVGT